SAVHRPFVPIGYVLPGGSSRLCGTRKQVRVTQSSDGDATTTSLGSGSAVPRSQIRPTGSPLQPMTSATKSGHSRPTNATCRRLIGIDNMSRDTQVKGTTQRRSVHMSRLVSVVTSIRQCNGDRFDVSLLLAVRTAIALTLGECRPIIFAAIGGDGCAYLRR